MGLFFHPIYLIHRCRLGRELGWVSSSALSTGEYCKKIGQPLSKEEKNMAVARRLWLDGPSPPTLNSFRGGGSEWPLSPLPSTVSGGLEEVVGWLFFSPPPDDNDNCKGLELSRERLFLSAPGGTSKTFGFSGGLAG